MSKSNWIGTAKLACGATVIGGLYFGALTALDGLEHALHVLPTEIIGGTTCTLLGDLALRLFRARGRGPDDHDDANGHGALCIEGELAEQLRALIEAMNHHEGPPPAT